MAETVPAEKFVQVDGGGCGGYGGVGLGLTIAKHLTSLIGGQISVESELGNGATFIVEIPQTYQKIGTQEQSVKTNLS